MSAGLSYSPNGIEGTGFNISLDQGYITAIAQTDMERYMVRPQIPAAGRSYVMTWNSGAGLNIYVNRTSLGNDSNPSLMNNNLSLE